MSDVGCAAGLCAGVPTLIVVEAVGAMRPGVARPYQALEREAFLVGRRRQGRSLCEVQHCVKLVAAFGSGGDWRRSSGCNTRPVQPCLGDQEAGAARAYFHKQPQTGSDVRP